MNGLLKRIKRTAPVVLIFLVWCSVTWAYDVVDVKNGGTIAGKITLRGPVPVPRAFPMVLYPFGDFCKKISNGEGVVLLREFNVDDSGGLQDAVIAVQKVKQGKAFRSRDTVLVTVNCMFHPADVPESEQFKFHHGKLVHVHPLLTVIRNDTLLSVVNRDPVSHATQVYQPEKGNRLLSFPVPVSLQPNQGMVHVEDGKRIVQIICEMHEYMQTWAWVVDNPYFAKSGTDGRFKIEKLPPGTYKVLAWHPHMKPIEKLVTISPHGVTKLDFEFDARQVIRPIYETQIRFRIPPERDPTVDLKGCKGPYCVRREDDHH